jgi:AsmA protein
MKKIITKAFKILGITVFVILSLLFLLPILFPGKIEQEVKTFANKKLNGELNFKEANLSFFTHFPSLTLSLENFSLKGSAPFQNDTLVAANEIGFGINIKDLVFHKKVTIDKIFLSDAFMNVKVNVKGEANYNVYVSDKKKVSEESEETSLRLEKIDIENTHLIYDDQSTKILIDAIGFNYVGKGGLDASVFDLKTKCDIDNFNFSFDKEQYLKNKKVKADLITKVNTKSLSFIFEENNLKINKLPIDFIGKLKFLKSGYDLDFKVGSTDSKLNDLFTALPPKYVTWLEKTKVKGTTDILLTFKGKYITATNEKPNLAFNMKIREGEINHKNAPTSATNIFLNFDTKLPALDVDRLKVTIDSIYFNVGKEYVKAIIKTEGIKKPKIDANIQTKINLAKLDQTIGLKNIDLKGVLDVNLLAKGIYDQENAILPVTKGNISFKNGYIKTQYYPNAIKNINLIAAVTDNLGSLKDLKIVLSPASFDFEGKPIYVKANLENFENIKYDVKAKGELDLAKIYKVFSQKGLDLKGYIKADVVLKGSQADAMSGNYSNLKNSGTLLLRNIRTKSQYLPKSFLIKEGNFTFNQDKLNFKNFLASYGKSDMVMNGNLQNVIDFVMTKKAILKGNFALNANYININEFMSAPAKSNTKETKNEEVKYEGVVNIPPNFDLRLQCLAKRVTFEALHLENLNGNVEMNKGILKLTNSGFDIIGSNVTMDVIYGSETSNKAFFDFKVLAKDFDVKRAYNEVELFREMVSAAKSAEGIISLDYKVAGKLDAAMKPIFPSLSGGGVLSVKNVKMKGFKLFNVVSKTTGSDKIKNPDLTKVDIKTTIKNNIITVERFKFKVFGFRPRIEGTTSFDGLLNMKMRLGLPPLGIIGIPLTITGTQENPKVKLGKKTEDLKETQYVETPKK